MGYVTKEMSARARRISVIDYVMQYESHLYKRVGRSFRLREHPSLAVSENGFFWHSRGQEYSGVTALDYLLKIRGYDFVSAVCHLIGERPLEKGEQIPAASKNISENVNPSKPTIQNNTVHQAISLPRRNKDNYIVIAYLQNRGIDKDLIKDCINRGVLYESAVTQNAVFLGKDENGKTRFAAMRGTQGDFKRDADGSCKDYGFLLPPENTESTTVTVYESPIDCLSAQTLCKRGYLPEYDGWHLSLGGTCTNALLHFIQNRPEINHCIIATDNDEPGNTAAEKIAQAVQEISKSKENPITMERSLPLLGKDWNDFLLSTLQTERKNIKDKGEISH